MRYIVLCNKEHCLVWVILALSMYYYGIEYLSTEVNLISQCYSMFSFEKIPGHVWVRVFQDHLLIWGGRLLWDASSTFDNLYRASTL